MGFPRSETTARKGSGCPSRSLEPEIDTVPPPGFREAPDGPMEARHPEPTPEGPDVISIQPGQTYRSLSNRHHPVDGPTRIKVVGTPIAIPGVWGFGKVAVVTVTKSGREVRRRSIEASQLHATATASNGQPRRTGYVLEQP